MNILKELTRDFQYEKNLVNPEIRKLISGPFRGMLVNKNGFCYRGSNTKTMKLLTDHGYYASTTKDKTWIKPWRLTALVWYDQTPSLHLIDSEKDKDRYLNLLAFIKVLEKYPDEYELLMSGSKTNYYPLSRGMIFNVVTGCLGRSCNNYKRHRLNEYERINWCFFEEIGDKIELDFYNFKDELSKELEKNLKSEPSTEISVPVEEPEEELEVCLSDPELGGAPSLRPKVKEVQTQSDNSSSKENKVNEYEDIPGYTSSSNITQKDKIKSGKDQIADQESLFDELVEACKNRDYARREYLQNKLINMGVSMEEIKAKINASIRAKSETKVSASSPIDELQELFDRRAQLKKELAEIEKKIKDSIFH